MSERVIKMREGGGGGIRARHIVSQTEEREIRRSIEDKRIVRSDRTGYKKRKQSPKAQDLLP